MKTTLATQLVQVWSLLDLRPTHRALLRHSAEQMVKTVHSQSDRKRKLAWHVASLRDSSDQVLLETMRRPGLLIVDLEGLMQRVIEGRASDAVINATHNRWNGQIRLLWHWSLQGKQDLMWCTERSFDGVIWDARTLKQWLRVCMRHGELIEGQSNTLLNGIELPRLASPKPTSI